MTTINAAGTLPSGWWMDETYRAWVEEQIRGYLKAGLNTREICQRTGVSGKTVDRIRTRPERDPDVETEAELRRGWIYDGLDAGDSITVIAERVGVHPATVRKYRARMQP